MLSGGAREVDTVDTVPLEVEVNRKNGRNSRMVMAFWSICWMARSTLW